MNQEIDFIREAFHYQSRFIGSTLVFKIDFPITAEPSFPSLMKDLALLAQTGFRVVIVPGAKEWIDSILAEYGIASGHVPAADKSTVRITSSRAMPFVEMAAFHVATRFMTALSANRCDSVIGNFVRARGLGVLDGKDMEHTGKAEKILVKPMEKVLDSGMVVILPCIGWSSSGKPYNVPSDEIALAAARALKAVKLFMVTAKEKDQLLCLTPKEAESILELDAKTDNTKTDNAKTDKDKAVKSHAELRLALSAVKAGVDRAHIIDGREEGAVLRELFSKLGAGTMVYADEYEEIRPLKTKDIPDVLRIMEPLMQDGILVRRTVENILEKKEDYWVAGIDGQAHASGALHLWKNKEGKKEGEIAAIAVNKAYADMGLGSRIVRFFINKAAKEGLCRIFVLTTQTQDWFEALGFTERNIESLPEERKKTYNQNRNSKIYALDL